MYIAIDENNYFVTWSTNSLNLDGCTCVQFDLPSYSDVLHRKSCVYTGTEQTKTKYKTEYYIVQDDVETVINESDIETYTEQGTEVLNRQVEDGTETYITYSWVFDEDKYNELVSNSTVAKSDSERITELEEEITELNEENTNALLAIAELYEASLE